MKTSIKANEKAGRKDANTKIFTPKFLNKFLFVFLLFVCFAFILDPKTYTQTCFDGITVWAVNVLPSLFPFFILTRLMVSLISYNPNKLDKLFNKIYNAPQGSSNIYFLALLSGYPMGAKLICTQYENGVYTKEDCKHMLAYCSVSGPMFMLGTVGIGFLKSYKAGFVVLIANILATLVNGFIYKSKSKPNLDSIIIGKQQKVDVADCVYDALISILMVGAYIVISFLIIELFTNTGILAFVSNCLAKPFCLDVNAVESSIVGLVEITRGALSLGKLNISLNIKTIIASGLIGFGGLSVFLQSFSFLNKLNLNKGYIFMQKLTQGLLATIISIPLALIFVKI